MAVPELTWNQPGPGTFDFETAASWTANQIPTANTDGLFPLDGNVDVIRFSTSVAKNVTFSDGVVPSVVFFAGTN